MKQILRLSPRVGIASSTVLLLVAALAGCSGGGDGGVPNFDPMATAHPSAPSSPIVVEGRLLVYLASEAASGPGGTNFNASNGGLVFGPDTDKGDDCAVVVDMTTRAETDLNVDTIDARIVGNSVYLMVSESADTKDWNLDAALDDTVLLHFSSTSALSFVDELDPGTHSLGVAGGRLYYVRGSSPVLMNGETSLAFLDQAMPKLPVPVMHTDVNNTLSPHILTIDEGLIFLTADETVEMRNLNGDGDVTPNDQFVLMLLDGTDAAGMVLNVGLSLASDQSPVRAHVTAAHDWLVGFLVDEASQSNFLTGLNDPDEPAFMFGGLWRPNSPAAGCGANYVDTDRLDQVLHVLTYALWKTDPIVNAPTNTGVPGTDRVLCTTNAVATLVKEVDDGGCDLNNDSDPSDKILRWVRSSDLRLPFGTSTQLNAVEDGLPGGSKGISDLAGKFICVVSELKDNTDHDGDTPANVGLTHNLVAWVDPNAATPTWIFDHNPNAGLTQSVGASSMADRPERDRLLVGFQESVFGQSINTLGDSDTNDSTPTFARFDPSVPNDLDFPGPAVALAAANPGIILAGGFGIYRVDEAADNRNWNGDTLKNDFVIFRTTLSTNFSSLIGLNLRATANNAAGPSIVTSPTAIGGAFLADEAMAGTDLNDPPDGGIPAFVVTWFRIGS